jgi:hypothetical protein
MQQCLSDENNIFYYHTDLVRNGEHVNYVFTWKKI